MRKLDFTNDSGGRKGLLCTRQLLALLLAVVMMTGTAMTFAACGNKAEETDVDLTETETISADDETTADDAEEATGEVSEENSEDASDETDESSSGDETTEDADGTDTETADGTEAEESTSVLDDTTKAVSVDETTAEATTGADANGYTYTTISDTIMYVKQQVNVRSIPTKNGDKLGALSAGTPVTVTGQCNETGWYRIAFNGGTGYVSNNYLVANKSEVETTTQASTTTTKKSSESSTTKTTTYNVTKLNKTMIATQQATIWSIPSTEGTILGTLSAGDEITVTGEYTEHGWWYQVQYKGKVGYVGNQGLCDNDFSTMYEKYIAVGINGLTGSEIEALYEEFIDEVVTLVNEERAKENLPAYKTSSLLTEAAMIRAEELATSYGHTRPDGTSCFTILSEVGFLYTDCGENAAMGQVTPTSVMTDWMNSTGHKANILNQPFVLDESTGEYTYINSYANGFYGYDTIGVGVYYEDGVFYWIQLFAHAHTHTWGEYIDGYWTWDDNDNLVYIEGLRASCTDNNCFAWKDASGTIYDEWRY